MKASAFIIGTALSLISCLGIPNTSYALQGPNILVVGEDADKDTIPRNSRVFRRVLDALSNQLYDQGFDVFDETAITSDTMAQGRVRRTDAELIDIARTITRPPIDVIVMFQIFVSAKELSYTTKVKTRVSGRLLHARSGQRFGNFEVISPREWNAPVDCSRECILEIVGKYARILASDVGSVLAEKLEDAVGGSDIADGGTTRAGVADKFTLVFEGFSLDDILDIEEYLVVFRGYESHRPIYSSIRRFEFWYVADISSSRLQRNLNKLLKELNMSGRVSFSGDEYTVTKISKRKRRKIKGDDW